MAYGQKASCCGPLKGHVSKYQKHFLSLQGFYRSTRNNIRTYFLHITVDENQERKQI